jgi:hypothetical protein
MNEVALIILTAGRLEYLNKTLESLDKNLKGNIVLKIIFDNSDGKKIIREGYKTIKVPSFGLDYGRIRHAKVMEYIFHAIKKINIEYVCFFEEDWELLTLIDSDKLIKYFTLEPNISQVRFFRKQKYIVDKKIDDFAFLVSDAEYLFSWNPSLFKKTLTETKYPIELFHEKRFGKKNNKPFIVYQRDGFVVKHIGEESLEAPGGKWLEKEDGYELQIPRIREI